MIITTKKGERIRVSPYNGQPVLERNYALNILKGIRSVGKTFFYKRRAVKRGYFDDRARFVWVRRYETELDKDFKDKFLQDIIHAANNPDSEFSKDDAKFFHDPKIVLYAGDIKLNDKVVGYYIPLSKTSGKKSIPYSDTDGIYFDEFLLKRGSPYHYIPDEFTTFMEFFSTVARTRPNVHAYLIGNNMSCVDPYSLALNIRPTNQRFTPIYNPYNGQANVLLEMYSDPTFANALYQTAIGQIIQGTQYGNYAIENAAFDDNQDFIKEKSKRAFFRFGLRYCGRWYGFWLDQNVGEMYVNTNVDLSCNRLYSLTRDDHTLNTLLITQRRNFFFFRELAAIYKTGGLYFDNVQIKSQVGDAIQYLL